MKIAAIAEGLVFPAAIHFVIAGVVLYMMFTGDKKLKKVTLIVTGLPLALNATSLIMQFALVGDMVIADSERLENVIELVISMGLSLVVFLLALKFITEHKLQV